MQTPVSQQLNDILVAAGFTSQHDLGDDLLVTMAKRYVEWMNSARGGEARPRLPAEEPKFYWVFFTIKGDTYESILPVHPLLWRETHVKYLQDQGLLSANDTVVVNNFHEIPEWAFRGCKFFQPNATGIRTAEGHEGRSPDQPDQHQEVRQGASEDSSPPLANEAGLSGVS